MTRPNIESRADRAALQGKKARAAKLFRMAEAACTKHGSAQRILRKRLALHCKKGPKA